MSKLSATLFPLLLTACTPLAAESTTKAVETVAPIIPSPIGDLTGMAAKAAREAVEQYVKEKGLTPTSPLGLSDWLTIIGIAVAGGQGGPVLSRWLSSRKKAT